MDFQNIIRNFFSEDVNEVFVSIASIILQIILITLLLRVLKWFIQHIFKYRFANWLNKHTRMSEARANTIGILTRNAIIYALYFVYFYWLLTIIGVPIGTLIAGAGIAGIAIGFGAQDFIKDLVNGFFIIFEGQYQIGDLITLPEEKITGTVIAVGIRTTELRAASGELYFIPNSSVNIVNNQSRQARFINIDLPVDTDVPIDFLESVIKKTATKIQADYAEIVLTEPTIVGFIRSSKPLFNYRVTFSVKNGEQYRHESLFYRAFLIAFEENDIPLSVNFFETIE